MLSEGGTSHSRSWPHSTSDASRAGMGTENGECLRAGVSLAPHRQIGKDSEGAAANARCSPAETNAAQSLGWG